MAPTPSSRSGRACSACRWRSTWTGIERKRKKWNRLAQAWYLVSERLATFCPTAVVTDALAIQSYYRERYRKETVFIPYGAEIGKTAGAGVLGELGLEAGALLPLRQPHGAGEPSARSAAGLRARGHIDEAGADRAMRPTRREYIRRVRDTRDARIVMPGAIYGEGYRELGSHCFAYIHATEVGGTHPALIEAMGRGALTLYRNTPENAEVAAGAGIPFEPEELTAKIELALAMPEEERVRLREAAMARVRERYSWEAVTDAYEGLLKRIAGSEGKRAVMAQTARPSRPRGPATSNKKSRF